MFLETVLRFRVTFERRNLKGLIYVTFSYSSINILFFGYFLSVYIRCFRKKFVPLHAKCGILNCAIL